MPANLTPQYLDAEEKFKAARTNEDKLAALNEMLSTIPKHKGTEKLQGEIKKKIAKFKLAPAKKAPKSREGLLYNVRKEGAGQVILVGTPNSGKSSFLARVTNAKPVIADFDGSTRAPLCGMMQFENIKIQIVDIPPIKEEYIEHWAFNLIKQADLVLLFVDLADPYLSDNYNELFKILNEKKIMLSQIREREKSKKTIVVINKSDLDIEDEFYNETKNIINLDLPITKISVEKEEGIDELKKEIFKDLDIIRIYSKTPGKKAEKKDPFILPKGSTLIKLASTVHKDFETTLKFARVWGEGKFEGQRINRNEVLHDEDVVELHT